MTIEQQIFHRSQVFEQRGYKAEQHDETALYQPSRRSKRRHEQASTDVLAQT